MPKKNNNNRKKIKLILNNIYTAKQNLTDMFVKWSFFSVNISNYLTHIRNIHQFDV